MEDPAHQLTQNLDYGIIYVCGNPKQTYNLRWFASMIEPMIRPLSLKWVETWDIDHTLIVARRFNVGNLGKYATVQLHLNEYGRSDSFSLLAAVHVFSDCLEDVMDSSEGDVIIKESDYNDRNALPEGKWGKSWTSVPMGETLRQYDMNALSQDNTRVEEPCWMSVERMRHEKASKATKPKKKRNWFQKLQRKSYDIIIDEDRDSLDCWDECQPCATPEEIDVYNDEGPESVNAELLDLEAEEVKEANQLESDYERDMNDLRARIVAFIAKYHKDPQEEIMSLLEGKVLLGPTPGHLLVNGDMKIVLPDYDEMEIKMPAMCRTLYILFMKKRAQGLGGIELRNMDQYRDELIEIYSLVKPGANEDLVLETVNNLCNPLHNSLNEKISKANGYIKRCIVDKNLQQQYLISGKRGEEYSIGLDPELMNLPRAVLPEN